MAQDLELGRGQADPALAALDAPALQVDEQVAVSDNSAAGRVYTRSELLELLRDYEALDQDEKTINVHVSHLRDKIEDDPAVPAFVLTVRGVGYAFAER